MKTRTIALLAGALSIAVLGGITAFVTTGDKDRFAECRKGAIAGGAAEIGGPLELVSETGKTVTDKEIFTRPSLLYFGYTYCPDVCPMDTVRNATAVRTRRRHGQGA